MKMKKYAFLLLLMVGACSSEMAKRGAYETLENMRVNQCNSDFSADCSQREGYDDYTRKREEVIK